MKYMLLIYQGTTPLPGTPEWDALSQEEQGTVYAAYGELNATPGQVVQLRITAGHVVTDPIEVVWEPPADGTAVYPRLVVEAGAGADREDDRAHGGERERDEGRRGRRRLGLEGGFEACVRRGQP